MPRLSFQHFTATVAIVALGGWAVTNAVMTGALRAPHQQDVPALGPQMRDYLLAHPEIITEAQQALARRQSAERQAGFKQAIVANHDAIFADPRDGREGAAKTAATLVIVYDYECPYCKAIQPTLARLVREHPDMAVIYKEFPILGPVSVYAAKASLAAVAQGKYPALHEALMASKIPEHQLTEEQVLEMAKNAGLDIDRLKTDMAAPDIEAKIAANKTLAASLGIQGTPGIIIGERLVSGNVPYEQLVAMIDQAKAPAGKEQ